MPYIMINNSKSSNNKTHNDLDYAIKWFVMRDLKRSNTKMPAYKQLRKVGFEVFTPMARRVVVRKEQQREVIAPFIHDLLFVHSSREKLDPVVDVTPTLQYRYSKGAAYREPMVVNDQEMERFIKAVTLTKDPRFFLPDEINATMIGKRIRITEGPLYNYEGVLVDIKGSKEPRLLVQLSYYLSAAVTLTGCRVEFI